jgi:SAM-dependent methyltransferase
MTASENLTQQAAEQPAHRKFVGPPEKYDLAAAGQFSLLAALGVREHHSLLDIGCGSLRAGKLIIPYLNSGNYCGMEPEQWLIDEGIKSEIGQSLADIKRPAFSNDTNFTLTVFNRKFDFLLANSVFSHATQAQIRRCFSQAKQVLAPTGIFAATYFEGEENYQGTEWVYPGRVHYRPEFFAQMASEAGLACTKLNWTHTNFQTWVAVTHPEHASAVPSVNDAARVGVLEHELQMARERLAELQELKGIKMLKKINRAMGRR